jgi:acyl-[acyl-carrier-protein] desaturase
MNHIANRGREIVDAIDSVIRDVYEDHVRRQQLWMPTELLPLEFKPAPVPPSVTAMLVLNLLTEDGLPYFFGLLTKHLGSEHAIWEWTRLWTGEEDRHGRALQLYLDQALTRKQLIALERLQYNYIQQGFWPDWGEDPVKLLAYVVLQEQATKVSHLGIALAAKDHDEVLFGLMKKVAAEEAKHHKAYLKMFQAALKADPTHALLALLSVIRNFAMPGNGIPGFAVLSEIQARTNVFGPAQFAAIVKEVTDKLGLQNLAGLDAAGEKAREEIFASAETLIRLGGRKRKKQALVLPDFADDFVFIL